MYQSEGVKWENGVCLIWNGILWGGRRFTLYFHWSVSQTEWFDLQLDQELAGTWHAVRQVVRHVKNIFNGYVDDVLGMLLNKLFDTSQNIGLRLIWAAGISQLSRWSQKIVAFIDYLSGVDIVGTHCIEDTDACKNGNRVWGAGRRLLRNNKSCQAQVQICSKQRLLMLG